MGAYVARALMAATLVSSCLASSAQAAQGSFRPPDMVKTEITRVRETDTVEGVPLALIRGDFINRTGQIQLHDVWTFAEPGAPWQATDTITYPRLPDRRLILAGCSKNFCVMHYELGGIGKSAHILAFVKEKHTWALIWSAVGFQPLANLEELRDLILSSLGPQYWDNPGYFF
jgi:hypothetical protein